MKSADICFEGVVMNYDRELFLVYLSAFTSKFPSLVLKFNKIYAEDKEHFYSAAHEKEGYTHSILNDGDLMQDVNNRRIFGIYCAAEDDDALHDRICDLLMNFEPRFRDYVKSFRVGNTKKAKNLLINISKKQASHNQIWGDSFVLYATHYLSNSIEKIISDDLRDRELCDPKRVRRLIDSIDIKDELDVNDDDWKIIKQIGSAREIDAVVGITEMLTGRFPIDSPRYPLQQTWISDTHPSRNARAREWSEMIEATHILFWMMEYHEISPTVTLRNLELSKRERDVILKVIIDHKKEMNQAFRHQPRMDTTEYLRPKVSISEYYQAFLFYALVKNFSETKKFYFDNNNETLFSQVSTLRKQNDALKDELTKTKADLKMQREHISLLQQQAASRNSNLGRDEKNLLKPYIEEISAMNKQIEKLERDLAQEQEKNHELNALREFAFDIKSEFIPKEADVSPSDIIKGKKIVVIGGHIEWRNKLKAAHPGIIVMDGHNAGGDFSVLSNANMVLLNTSNMSHSVYDKAIEILRHEKIRFDYLGRATNQDRYEKEIVALLRKHGF